MEKAKSKLGQAFEDSKRLKESDLVTRAIKDTLVAKSNDNGGGDDRIIRKWTSSREMANTNVG